MYASSKPYTTPLFPLMPPSTFTTLPPEMYGQFFDVLIQEPRKICLTNRRLNFNIFLSLLQSCIIVRDHITTWFISRPRLIWSDIRSIGIYDPVNTTFVFDFSKKGGVLERPIAKGKSSVNSEHILIQLAGVKTSRTAGVLLTQCRHSRF